MLATRTDWEGEESDENEKQIIIVNAPAPILLPRWDFQTILRIDPDVEPNEIAICEFKSWNIEGMNMILAVRVISNDGDTITIDLGDLPIDMIESNIMILEELREIMGAYLRLN